MKLSAIYVTFCLNTEHYCLYFAEPEFQSHSTATCNFKECHPRCAGKLDRWEGSQKHNSYDI